MSARTPVIERLLRSCEETDDGCWRCLLNHDADGYARIKIEGKYERAHRIALLYMGTSVPDGATLACHTCDNRDCINPAHLYWGTTRDNEDDKVRDGRAKGRFGKGRTITDEDKVTAVLMLSQHTDFSQSVIGNLLGIHQTRVSEILRNTHWSTHDDR